MNRVNKTNCKYIFLYFFARRATLKESFTAKYKGVLPRKPYVRPKSEIYTPKARDEYPRSFRMEYPLGVTFFPEITFLYINGALEESLEVVGTL